MIELRVHHLYCFTKALISERYRRQYIRDSYSERQQQIVKQLLTSITDSTPIRIVTGIDKICRSCNPDENCRFPDSIWEAKEFMYKIQPNEIVTAGYLKKQYRLFQEVRTNSDWKRRIIESREQK